MADSPEEVGQYAGQAGQPVVSEPNRRIVYGLLAVITVLGICLRFWGIGWGLPDVRRPLATYHPDEVINFSASQRVDMLGGKFDVGFYSYGAFYFYLVDAAKIIGRGYGAIPTTPNLPADSPPLSEMQSAERQLPEIRGLYLAGRIVSAVAGVLTIAVLFALARRLFGERVGLTAALLYAAAPLAAVHAHFFTVDVCATLFVTLALLASARLLESQHWKEYLIAGICTGLAAATKYSAGLVLVAPVAAHILASPHDGRGKPRLFGPLVLVAATTLVFLTACPGPIINWDAFWNGMAEFGPSGLKYELFQHSRQGHGLLFVNTGPGWWYHLVISLRYGLGLPLLLLAATGIASAIGARTKQDRLLLWFVLVFYGITSLSAVRFARYMIPLYPALCVIAARRVWQIKPRTLHHHAVPAAFGLLVLLTGGYTVSLVHAMASRDPRDTAADYLQAKAPQGATVAFAKVPWYFSPPLSPWFGAVSPRLREKCLESTRYTFLLPHEGSEFDVSVLTPSPNYIVLSNIEAAPEIRLRTPAAQSFLELARRGRSSMVFGPPALFDMAFSGELVPDDLLYILPRITVYTSPMSR